MEKPGEKSILDTYAAGVLAGWDAGELYRLIIKNTMRQFHNASEEGRRQILERPPALTGTRWDALMAAVVEHLAASHGYERPDWVDETPRFAPEPVRFTRGDEPETNAATCPGAFLRHGTLIDPRSLDSRGGEQTQWAEETC